MIKIKPPTSDLSAQTLIEIKDDRVFYEYFCRAAEKGVKVAKYRFKNNPLQKGKSEHPMSIKNPNTKDAEFVYHKFRCLLTDISNVTKGYLFS